MPVFDVASNHSDHHYTNTKHGQISSTATKTIMNEWRILEQNLPETIHVRAYETRIDLLRAVIVGAHGTPYEHGLFFFDIKFPNDYPNNPPQVHYISHGLSLNPNLHDSGYVCLSLLNTWIGIKPSESWVPSKSTIFQVLLSIQALVLNHDPVFNDPFEAFMMWLFGKSPQEYSDKAFVNTCRSTLYVMRCPPRNFEGFVTEHFHDRASRILKACQEFKRYGYYSLASKKSMEELYPQLVNAFEENGAVMVNADDDDIEAQLIMGFEKSKDRLKSNKPTVGRILARMIVGFSILLIVSLCCWSFVRFTRSIFGYIFALV